MRHRSRATRQKFLPVYRQLLGEADRWFDQAAAALADHVQCRAGCSLCCHGLFDISVADAELVAQGFASADGARREALRLAATELLAEVGRLAPGWAPPWRLGDIDAARFEAIADALAERRCVALGPDGSCQIYDHRPLICRLHGLPMYDPQAQRECGGACSLNAIPGEPAATACLHFPHERFERDEIAVLEAMTRNTGARAWEDEATIVAAAVWRAVHEESDDDS